MSPLPTLRILPTPIAPPTSSHSLTLSLSLTLFPAIQGLPEGLETPAYTVVETGKDFEVREYQGFTVASRDNPPGFTGSGSSFNALASYLFGMNKQSQPMEMTTPVLMRKGSGAEVMQFVIPKKDEASGVPTPMSEEVRIEKMPPARYAVREFPGFVTDAEIEYQKCKLLASLEEAGYAPPLPGVTIAQYNPPQTLPTFKRNEVMVLLSSTATTEGFAISQDGAVCPSADYLAQVVKAPSPQTRLEALAASP